MGTLTEKPFSQQDLRGALSGFATGVTIVTTTSADGEKIGMTASSFNSVSMDPPLILWSVTKSAHSSEIFRAAKHFCVHVLSTDQMETSNLFATRGADKFANIDHALDGRGVPVLAGCVSRFDCTTWATYEGGDHWIIVGEVDDLERTGAESLLFHGGQYSIASALTAPHSDTPSESGVDGEIDDLLIYQLALLHRQLTENFHETVHESGLTVPQWRVLASLMGEAERNFDDLQWRALIEPETLTDTLNELQADGLCTLEGGGKRPLVRGTAKGNETVSRLMELGREQEKMVGRGPHPIDLEHLKDQVGKALENTIDAHK